MTPEEIDEFIKKERKRLAKEKKSESRDDAIDSLIESTKKIAAISTMVILAFVLVGFLFFAGENQEPSNVTNTTGKIDVGTTINGAGSITPTGTNSNTTNNTSVNNTAEYFRLAKLEKERLDRLERERLERERKERIEKLEKVCVDIFEDSMDDYDGHKMFEKKSDALDWLNKETSERLIITDTFEERLPYQLRFGFLNNKISLSKTFPILIAVGDLDSNNWNDSEGMVCNNVSFVEFYGDARAALLYGITMRREWV